MVPLLAAAVCPHPPLLVPDVAAGAAAELDSCRAACRTAVEALASVSVSALIVVGSGPEDRLFTTVGGSFAPWGVDRTVGDPTGDLPLSLLVGAWLVDGYPFNNQTFWSVGTDSSPNDCAALGASLVGDAAVAMLVMGDGSACRSEKAPGYFDHRAESFDASVASALADADGKALLDLDPSLAAELRVAGRAPWQVLAGAGASLRGELLYHEAPYGVGYFVASWR